MTDLFVTEASIHAGQAVYTRLMLQVYDVLVTRFSNRVVWRCPKHIQLAHYQHHASNHHLDIGVGTGYYLKHNQWPKSTRLALMDINLDCLKAAKRATARLLPKVHHADVFKAQPQLAAEFDSISIHYLLHCLPGNIQTKSVALENIIDMLKPQGVLFGTTILSDEHLQTPMSRRLAKFYNQKNIFSNRYDTETSLGIVLRKYLEHVEIKVVGCVALFKGYKSLNR